MDKAQQFGIWGCFLLGGLLLVTTAFKGGFEDPIQFAGGASLLVLGSAMWLFRKASEQPDKDTPDASREKE